MSEEQVKAINDAAHALEEAIIANAPACASRDHATNMIKDVLHCAYYAIALGSETDTPGVPT